MYKYKLTIKVTGFFLAGLNQQDNWAPNSLKLSSDIDQL